MPPRLGLSLLKAFVAADQYDAAVGDLCEEFANRERISEPTTARRWFWHQTWRTIGHFLLDQFREAPIVNATLIVVAFLALFFSYVPENWAITAILKHYHPYYYVSAPTFWFIFDIPVSSIFIPLLIGWFFFGISGSRGMITIVGVLVLSAILPLILCVIAYLWYLRYPVPGFKFNLVHPGRWIVNTVLLRFAFLIGGMLRQCRREPFKGFFPIGR